MQIDTMPINLCQDVSEDPQKSITTFSDTCHHKTARSRGNLAFRQQGPTGDWHLDSKDLRGPLFETARSPRDRAFARIVTSSITTHQIFSNLPKITFTHNFSKIIKTRLPFLSKRHLVFYQIAASCFIKTPPRVLSKLIKTRNCHFSKPEIVVSQNRKS